MTGEQRQRIRHAIDAHIRAERARFIAEVGRLVCRGCGTDLDSYTVGCNPCGDRRRARARAEAKA